MLAATKIFASNFNAKMSQRFYNIFLLVRGDVTGDVTTGWCECVNVARPDRSSNLPCHFTPGKNLLYVEYCNTDLHLPTLLMENTYIQLVYDADFLFDIIVMWVMLQVCNRRIDIGPADFAALWYIPYKLQVWTPFDGETRGHRVNVCCHVFFSAIHVSDHIFWVGLESAIRCPMVVMIDRSINQSVDQSIDLIINQSINLPIIDQCCWTFSHYHHQPVATCIQVYKNMIMV